MININPKCENIYILFNDYATLTIGGGKHDGITAYIDLEDVEKCKQHQWGVRADYSANRFIIYDAQNKINLNKFVTNTKRDNRVYFIDGDILNCRKSNLSYLQKDMVIKKNNSKKRTSKKEEKTNKSVFEKYINGVRVTQIILDNKRYQTCLLCQKFFLVTGSNSKYCETCRIEENIRKTIVNAKNKKLQKLDSGKERLSYVSNSDKND